jgi:ribose/xylose/arabinose/galactoside ABC-type transport system permease subunit
MSIRLPVLVMIALVIAAFIFEKKTVAGRRTYLIGANREAARLSGIKVTRHLPRSTSSAPLLAGITGILMASEFRAGVSSRAMGFEFDALVIALLGGVSIAGGFGSVLGMLVGAIILAVVTSSATGLLLSPDWQFTLKGSSPSSQLSRSVTPWTKGRANASTIAGHFRRGAQCREKCTGYLN